MYVGLSPYFADQQLFIPPIEHVSQYPAHDLLVVEEGDTRVPQTSM